MLLGLGIGLVIILLLLGTLFVIWPRPPKPRKRVVAEDILRRQRERKAPKG